MCPRLNLQMHLRQSQLLHANRRQKRPLVRKPLLQILDSEVQGFLVDGRVVDGEFVDGRHAFAAGKFDCVVDVFEGLDVVRVDGPGEK